MAQPVDRAPGSGDPRVWLVVGEKLGDNAQVLNVARATGWACEERKIIVKPEWETRKPPVRPTLGHVDLARSDALEPPWPDLVITSGRRPSSVGLWIKQQSGGRTRVVMVGRPRRLFDAFDLIVVASHYMLPDGPNVLHHDLPLMHVDPARLEDAMARWRPRLEALPRPLCALMVGGPTSDFRLDLAGARDLHAKATADVERHGGSLVVVTSRRTPRDVVDFLRGACADPTRLYVFDPEASADENPYHALLGLADHFIVTSDSISMMVEVARLGRSLSIHPLDIEIGLFERALLALGLLQPLSPRTDRIPGGGLRARTMLRLGRESYSRDLSAIPRLLVGQGRAVWLGDDRVEPGTLVDDELERIAARIRGLLDEPVAAAAPVAR